MSLNEWMISFESLNFIHPLSFPSLQAHNHDEKKGHNPYISFPGCTSSNPIIEEALRRCRRAKMRN
jgi:hypothetical protein